MDGPGGSGVSVMMKSVFGDGLHGGANGSGSENDAGGETSSNGRVW